MKPRRPRAETPKGFRDYFGAEVRARAAMLARITEVYHAWGFEPLETSAVETVEALGKFLPDVDRAGLQRIEAPAVIDLGDPRQHRRPCPHLGAEIVAEAPGRLGPGAARLVRLVLGHRTGSGGVSGASLARAPPMGKLSRPRARRSGRGGR